MTFCMPSPSRTSVKDGNGKRNWKLGIVEKEMIVNLMHAVNTGQPPVITACHSRPRPGRSLSLSDSLFSCIWAWTSEYTHCVVH